MLERTFISGVAAVALKRAAISVHPGIWSKLMNNTYKTSEPDIEKQGCFEIGKGRKILIILSVSLTVGLYTILRIIIPNFMETFEEMGAELAGLTILILRIYIIYPYIALATIIGAVVILFCWHPKKYKALLYKILLAQPILAICIFILSWCGVYLPAF